MQTIANLLQVLEESGLSIALENGEPRLRGATKNASKALLETLKSRRTEIIGYLQQPTYRHREWLDEYFHHYKSFTDRERFGAKTTCEIPPFHDMSYHPKGCRWWRFVGEREWRPVDQNETLPAPPPEAPDNVPDDELWRYL